MFPNSDPQQCTTLCTVAARLCAQCARCSARSLTLSQRDVLALTLYRCALGARPITTLPHQPGLVATQGPRSRHQAAISITTEKLMLRQASFPPLKRPGRDIKDQVTTPKPAHSSISVEKKNLCRDTPKVPATHGPVATSEFFSRH